MARRLGVEAAQPDGMHLELGGQQVANLAGLVVATIGEVLQRLSPLRSPGAASRLFNDR